MSTAVGVCSRNRPTDLLRTLKSIKGTCVTDPYIFVALDGPDKKSIAMLVRDKIPFIVSPQVGIAHIKNIILNVLRRYDYGFIIEDDIRIIKKGWDAAYIELHQATDIHHFCFQRKMSHAKELRKIRTIKTSHPSLPETLTLAYSMHKPNGLVMFMTKDAIERVGGFYNGFNPYGYEHVDWTFRSQKAGLMPDVPVRSVSFWEDTDFFANRTGCKEIFTRDQTMSYIRTTERLFYKRCKLKVLYEPIEFDKKNLQYVGVWP